jgi:hypothetical protein
MKPELKKKWVKALRSGYEQGRVRLRKETSDGASYCCLGVLLCVSGTIRHFNEDEDEHYKFLDSELGWTTRARLIQMNDGERKSFDAIADYIEQNI